MLLPRLLLAAPLVLCSAGTAVPQEQRAVSAAADHVPEPLVVTERPGAGPVARAGRVFLSGHPSPEALASLAREGVRTAVDLGGWMGPGALEVEAQARRLGLGHVRLTLPGDSAAPDAVLDEARKILRRHVFDPRAGSVLFHASTPGPAAAVWATARVLDEGVDWPTALAEARRAGSQPGALEDSARYYVLGAGKQELGRWKERIRAELPDVKRIGVAELDALLRTDGPRPLLLDTRAPAEFAVSHLPGARCAPGVAEAVSFLQGGPRDREVVVYCSIGYRSARLAQALTERGFTAVRNLEGSIFEWANTGHDVFRGGVPVRAVHPYDRKWGLLLERELWAWTPTR